MEADGDRLTGVRLASGQVVPRDALAVSPTFTARSALLASLGLPGLAGFWGEVMALLSSFNPNEALGLDDTRRLGAARPGSRIRLPGLVLMRQRPGTAKGVVFVTVEDEFGAANLVVYAQVGARDRRALVGARLLLAEGRVERETERAEVPITHVIARRLHDRADLLRRLREAPGEGLPELGRSRDFR